MPRDHQVLIGGYHPSRRGGAGARDLWAAFGIGLLIQRDAEPVRLAAGTRPYLGRVLADARGEHECVQSAERRSKRPELASDAVDKQVDGASFADCVLLASKVRMSLEMPETPRRPERW